jgi:hypothetical protein
MVCSRTCLIAMMFIIGNLIFTYLIGRNSIIRNYQDSLDETQQKIYKNIVDERKKIALQGYFLGLGLSIGALITRYFLVKDKRSLLNTSISGLCITIVMTFITQYFYYILIPKTDWMLHHLKTDQQKQQWLKVYRSYSWNYHISMLIGLIGAGLLGYSIC